jgi:phosphoglycolate phosphatase
MSLLLVFDLDGTLIDSRRDLARAANALLARHGAPPLDEPAVGGMVGEGAGVLVSRVLAARGLDVPQAEALDEFLRGYDECLLDTTRPYDGIPAALDACRSVGRLATLTNKPEAAATRILEALGLRARFDWVLGGDSPHGRKPAPGGLEWLMRQAGAVAADTLLVGDSKIDVLTARAAGVAMCVAAYGFGFENVPPGLLTGDDWTLARPADLPAVVDRWRARAAQGRGRASS